MINISSIVGMTHKDLVKAYREIERKYKLKYKRTTNVVRQELPEFTGWVKYDRNISQASLVKVQKALEDLEYEIRFQQAKKQRQARQARKKKFADPFPTPTPVPTPPPGIPSDADIEWDILEQTLKDVYANSMSTDQMAYNAAAVHHYGGEEGLLRQGNANDIQEIFDAALDRLVHAGMSEQDAKRAILDAVKPVFAGHNLAYELERLAYGFYDPQYRKGTGGYTRKLTEIRAAVNGVQSNK